MRLKDVINYNIPLKKTPSSVGGDHLGGDIGEFHIEIPTKYNSINLWIGKGELRNGGMFWGRLFKEPLEIYL